MLFLFRKVVCLSCLFVAAGAFAQERRYTVGTTIDLVGGSTNSMNGFNAQAQQQTKPYFFFYGAFPSLSLTSVGPRSVINASYAAGISRAETESNFRSNSQSATISYSNTRSSTWKVNVSESFQMTEDAAAFNAFRGVTPPPEDFRFVFNPVAIRLTTRT